MAAIVPTTVEILRVSDLGQEETLTVAHDVDRQGKIFFVAPATGLATLASAADLAATGATATEGAILGMASTPPRSNLAQESVTLLRDADVWLGAGVLDGLDFGAPVYLAATVDGGLDDTAPAVAADALVPIGHVVPFSRESGIDKGLRIDTVWAARPGAIAVVGA